MGIFYLTLHNNIEKFHIIVKSMIWTSLQNGHLGTESEFNGLYTIIAIVTMNFIDYHIWTSKNNNCNYILGTYSVMGTVMHHL